MNTAPGVQALGVFTLYLNKNRSVVLWCPIHQTWVAAAHATLHFDSRLHLPEPK